MKRKTLKLATIMLLAVTLLNLTGCVEDIVISVEAEGDMSMVFLDSGERYLWGSNSTYRSSSQEDSAVVTPSAFTLVEGVIDFAAGDNFVSWLTGTGFLMSGEKRYMPTDTNSEMRPALPTLLEGQSDGLVAYTADSSTYNINKINDTLRDVEQVVAGQYHTVVLKSNGTVWSWDSNGTMQRVGILEGIGSISTGRFGLSAALDLDGYVWTWQHGADAEPVRVEGVQDIIQITTTDSYWAALDMDGNVWTWSPLGAEPTLVQELSEIINFTSGDSFTAALDKSGNVWTWGSVAETQLGRSTELPEVPGTVSDLDGIIAISAGSEHVLAIRKDGTVWAWGSNDMGQLGDGTLESSIKPVKVVLG